MMILLEMMMILVVMIVLVTNNEMFVDNCLPGIENVTLMTMILDFDHGSGDILK